jgi:hypothetical protein
MSSILIYYFDCFFFCFPNEVPSVRLPDPSKQFLPLSFKAPAFVSPFHILFCCCSVAKFTVPDWGNSQLRQWVVVPARQPGGPVRQPNAGVDFIPPVRDYEFGYCIHKRSSGRKPSVNYFDKTSDMKLFRRQRRHKI